MFETLASRVVNYARGKGRHNIALLSGPRLGILHALDAIGRALITVSTQTTASSIGPSRAPRMRDRPQVDDTQAKVVERPCSSPSTIAPHVGIIPSLSITCDISLSMGCFCFTY